MKLQIKNSGVKLTESDLSKLETRIGSKIPEMYKAFLLLHNGGYPESGVFIVEEGDWKEEISVEYFLGINENEFFDLEKSYKKLHKILPAGFFPVALVGGSSLVCIQTTGENLDNVFFWDSEEILNKKKNFYKVADDFNKFISQIESTA